MKIQWGAGPFDLAVTSVTVAAALAIGHPTLVAAAWLSLVVSFVRVTGRALMRLADRRAWRRAVRCLVNNLADASLARFMSGGRWEA